jgi:nucleoside-diphosphate-sugar epimerase
MRYFVTGATGFIGGQVARQLRAAGHEVVTIARSPEKAADLKALGVEVYKGDITDGRGLRAPMSGADGIFHLAGWYKVGVRDTSQAQQVNVEGTRNVLEMMKKLRIPKGVYTSTLAVFSDTHGHLVDENYKDNGPFLSEYDRTKWEAHYNVALPMIKEGLPLVIVQPGLVYGPGDTSAVRDTLLAYLRQRLPMAPSKTAFCWAHVEDVARGHLLAMEKGKAGRTYIIAGPPHTLVEALDTAEQITGIAAPRIHPSPGVMKLMAALMKPLGSVLRLPSSYSPEGMRIVAGVTYIGSNEKARRELGYSPRPLEEGLKETLEHEMKLLGMQPNKKGNTE